MTPADKWAQGELDRIIEHPVEIVLLDVILGHPASRRVFHYGVEVNGLYYNCPELQLLRRRYGEDLHVDLKYHEDELGFVHVFDPDRKAYILVDAVDQEYASGLRLIQHELVRADIRQVDGDPGKQALLRQKKQELQTVIAGALNAKRMASRKKGAVLKGVTSAATFEAVTNLGPVSLGPASAGVTVEDDIGEVPNFAVRTRQPQHY